MLLPGFTGNIRFSGYVGYKQLEHETVFIAFLHHFQLSGEHDGKCFENASDDRCRYIRMLYIKNTDGH